MALLKVICRDLIFIKRIRFLPDKFLATILKKTNPCANSCYINLTNKYTNIFIMNKYTFYHSEDLVLEEELLVSEKEQLPVSEEEQPLLSDKDWAQKKNHQRVTRNGPYLLLENGDEKHLPRVSGGRVRGGAAKGGWGRHKTTNGRPQGHDSGKGNAKLRSVASTSTTKKSPLSISYDDYDVTNSLPPF